MDSGKITTGESSEILSIVTEGLAGKTGIIMSADTGMGFEAASIFLVCCDGLVATEWGATLTRISESCVKSSVEQGADR